ncbi:hypothetical protein DPMN_114368 [Dreissena polymorpha]|uniref:Uncharacterized protein n=1 Tax=Dreissena polymorpha TaxID=45954 RepID=A0A9D4KJV8_DREPO|nr:hypothetical protein DPMN_114368 [Dreissena polymorpha]
MVDVTGQRPMAGATWSKSCPYQAKIKVWSDVDRRKAEVTWSSSCSVSRTVKDR